ncbi:unnamed protein product, partial [Protopolystoma xenopodis]
MHACIHVPDRRCIERRNQGRGLCLLYDCTHTRSLASSVKLGKDAAGVIARRATPPNGFGLASSARQISQRCSLDLDVSTLRQVKNDFLALLKEQKGLNRHSHWGDFKKKLDSDPRYKAVDSSSRREEWFRDYTRKLDNTVRESSKDLLDREKKERQEASIREREKAVKEALSSSL